MSELVATFPVDQACEDEAVPFARREFPPYAVGLLLAASFWAGWSAFGLLVG